MTRVTRFAFIVAAIAAGIVVTRSEVSAQPTLRCDIGPVAKTYGKIQWRVFSCDDNRTVVISSAPGNPAMPFYFRFSPTDSGYRLSGEGTGKKEATAAAFNELKKLSGKDIAALIQQTKSVSKP